MHKIRATRREERRDNLRDRGRDLGFAIEVGLHGTGVDPGGYGDSTEIGGGKGGGRRSGHGDIYARNGMSCQ